MPIYSIRRLCWAGPLATLIALLVDLAYFAISKTLGEEYLIPLTENGSQLAPIPAVTIIFTILVSGLTATVLFGLLVRFARKPVMVFLSVAITALLISLGGPFSLPIAGTKTKLLLSGMHVFAAVIICAGILLLSRARNNLKHR